jgi:hypothetical protein
MRSVFIRVDCTVSRKCDKLAYASQKLAVKAAKQFKLNSKKTLRLREYECPKCGKWHHTSNI